jgi:hypothetical protein
MESKMKHFKSRQFQAGVLILLLAGLTSLPSAAQDTTTKKKDQPSTSTTRPATPSAQPGGKTAPGAMGGKTGGTTSPGTTGGKAGGTTTAATTAGKTGGTNTVATAGGKAGGTTKPAVATGKTGGTTTPSTTGTRSGATTTTPPTSASKTGGTTAQAATISKTGATAAPVADKSKAGKQETVKRQDGAEQTTKYSATGLKQKEVVKAKDGTHTTQFSPGGRPQKEVVERSDGSKHTTEYGLNGQAKREEVVNKDGTKEVTVHQTGRDGVVRAQETVKYDVRGVEVSKSVTIRNTTIINRTIIQNATIVNDTVVRNYDRGRFGFVYRPELVALRPALVSWYDPYWYSPAGVLVVHPFHFSWGWEGYDWYHRYHGPYFTAYEVYPAPSYWVTDWLVAGYVADHFAATLSVAQAREEARIAREEAVKASEAAAAARLEATEAEVAAARQAQALAEFKAADAEKRAAIAERMEANADKPNPNAVPIDKDTKEALKNQIEQAVAEKKQLADQAAQGQPPILPDLSRTLADPNHIYPVSKTVLVLNAADEKPAGAISEGDLLKLEPSQADTLKDAAETTLVTMRVMTSKGEEGEVIAGTVVKVSLKDLQEFDSEFRAKLDVGLAEAEKNKEQFKHGT